MTFFVMRSIFEVRYSSSRLLCSVGAQRFNLCGHARLARNHKKTILRNNPTPCAPISQPLQVGLLDFIQVFLLLRVLLFCSSSSSPMAPQIFLSRDRPLRTTLPSMAPPPPLPPYTNLPLPEQASQDLATSYGSYTQIFRSRDRPLRTTLPSMAPIHKPSSARTGLSGPRYFHGPHTQIFRSWDRPIRTSVLLWPPYTNLPLPGQACLDHATLYGPHTQSFLSRDRPLRTSLLLWPPNTNVPLPGQASQDLATSVAPPYTNFPLPGQASQDLATSLAPTHKSSAPRTGLSGPCYSLWPPYANLPLLGQATQDLATSMAPVHKSYAPGTGLS